MDEIDLSALNLAGIGDLTLTENASGVLVGVAGHGSILLDGMTLAALDLDVFDF